MKPKPRLFSRVLAFFMAFALLLTALPPSVFAMEPSDIEDAIPLTLDEPVSFTNEDGKLVLSFTPEESRDYVLYLQYADNCEPYVEWFDADLNRMRGWNLSQEPASLYLQAGTAIYYEITNIQDSAYFSATVCLTMPSYITFDANGGYFGDNADDSFRYFTTDENKYLTDEIPENVNHADSHKRFVGWAESPDAEAPLDNYYEAIRYRQYTEDAVFYAVYEESYVVTYDANGGYFYEDEWNEETQEWVRNEVPTYTRIYPYGMRFDVSVRPENDDSSKWFMGWKDAGGTTYDWNSEVTQDLTVYAQWADATTITFHANGGYFIEWGWDEETGQGIENHVDTLSESYLKEDPLYSWNTPTAHNDDESKAFAGWATSADAVTPDVVYEETLAGDLTDLWAVWSEGIPVTYHINHDEITFIGDDNERFTEFTSYYPAGESFYIGHPPYNYSKPDGSLWQLAGLSTNPNATQGDYREITLTEPLDLYCVWYKGVEIRFDANGGYFQNDPNYTSANSVFRLGETAYEIPSHFIDELTPPEPGLALAGWSWTADGSDPVTGDLAITRDLNGRTLYAIWSGGIPVTFHINNEGAWFFNEQGKEVDTITRIYASGATLRSYEQPFPYGVEEDSFLCLDGLSLDPNASRNDYWEITVTEPIDVYCIWYLGVEINVDANGGYFWNDPQNTAFVNIFRIGDTINLLNYWGGNWISHPDPDKALVGFSWSRDGSNPFTEFTPSEDDQYKTLYAVWVDGIKVTFHVNSDIVRFIDGNGNLVEAIQKSFAPGTVLWSYNDFFNYDTSGDPFLHYEGFFPEPAPSQTYVREYTITKPTDFYCSWFRGINFLFDANGGYFSGPDGTLVPVMLGIGQSYNLLTYWSHDLIAPDPSKTLVGWSWTADGSELITDSTEFIPTEAMNGKTIYAVWGDGITVTYHSLNENVWFLDSSGNKTDTIQASYTQGTVLDLYNIDVHYYYDDSVSRWFFDRYYLDAGGTTRVDDNITITEPIDLYCTWFEGVSINMNANGGLFWGEQEVVNYLFRLGETRDFENGFFPNIAPPAPDLVLSGWSWKQDGSDPVTTVKMTKDLDGKTLYAIWSDDGSNVPVTGVSFANSSVTIKVEETKSCPATVAPANATNKKVTYKSSDESIVTVDTNGKITGQRTGSATITATTSDGGKKATMKVEVLFKDVADSSKYWYAPVYWAADKGITNGYQSASYIGTDKFGTFGAEENCTREQMITFLYREAGSPAVSSADIAKYNTFSDVKTSANPYYLKPVVWAAKNGITKGYSSGPNKGKFGVGLTVTREDTVTFIYRMAKKYQKNFLDVTAADLKNKSYSFTDVESGKYYQNPIVWAAKNGITKGYSSGVNKGKFGVGFNVLRKDIVTFLYRYDNL